MTANATRQRRHHQSRVECTKEKYDISPGRLADEQQRVVFSLMESGHSLEAISKSAAFSEKGLRTPTMYALRRFAAVCRNSRGHPLARVVD